MGYEVCGKASRAEQALEAIPAARPDVVLVDINLGGGPSGIDLVDRLEGVCDAPCIFLTAYSDAALVDRALETRSFAYLVKPFQSEGLRANIEMALRVAAAERLLREQAAELRRSQALLQAAFDATADGILVIDRHGAVVGANKRIHDMWRVPGDLDDPPTGGILLAIAAQLSPEASLELELACALRPGSCERLRHPDGRTFERRTHPQMLDGQAVGQVVSFRDVTAREAAVRAVRRRELLESDNRHRTQLLHELNHRVKNNLQMIVAMLRLDCGDLPYPAVQDKLTSILDRIGAIALVHDQLSVADPSNVDAAAFLRRLARDVLAAHARDGAIDLEVSEQAPILLPPEELMAVGMIASELLVNAARHAFPSGGTGHVRVAVTARDERGCIVVEDDGVGGPPNIDEAASLGVRLVRSLAAGLGAEIAFEGKETGGTRVTLLLARSTPARTRASESEPSQPTPTPLPAR